MLAAKDKSGTSLEEVLRQEMAAQTGSDGGEEDILDAVQALALLPSAVREYIEVHIEQVQIEKLILVG
jgi:hypothetical protein